MSRFRCLKTLPRLLDRAKFRRVSGYRQISKRVRSGHEMVFWIGVLRVEREGIDEILRIFKKSQ